MRQQQGKKAARAQQGTPRSGNASSDDQVEGSLIWTSWCAHLGIIRGL
jgi:hypothetical protein